MEKIPDTTRIIISQRISSVENADKIIVMDGGKVVEQNEPHAFFANPKEQRTIDFLSKVL